MGDEDLVERLKKGEIGSYEILFQKYYDHLFLFAKGMLKGEWIAEDIVQNAFLKLWYNREALQGYQIQAYLFTLVKNEIFNYLRSKAVLAKYKLHIEHTAESKIDPESEYCKKEVYENVEKIVASMPPKRQEIYRMHRELGLTYAEIASIKNISVKTVEKQIELALKTIRGKFSAFSFFLFLIFF